MVKNVKGGSGHKSQGRKFVLSASNSKQSSKLRIVEEEGEIYGQITKMYGNGMCDALCIDNVTRLCIIRGKFRGRGKRDNILHVGSWILAGRRDWESVKVDEKQKCDLLEVYSDFDVERLKKNVNVNWKIFVNLDSEKAAISSDDYLEFTNSNTDEYQRIIQTLEKNPNSKITLEAVAENENLDEDEAWFDEI
jgi:initiation factor 1A